MLGMCRLVYGMVYGTLRYKELYTLLPNYYILRNKIVVPFYLNNMKLLTFFFRSLMQEMISLNDTLPTLYERSFDANVYS
jgi:hypothetical protein